MISKHPAIYEANEKAKRKSKILYRGVGFGDEYVGETEVINKDKKQQFVATSRSAHAAMNFALMKGHMDADRRSEYGYMIQYQVDPSCIILDTSIFMTVYGESEVLIDASKATVHEIERV